MQVILVILSVLSLELFRRFRLREPWKVLLLLVLSGGATAISTIIMIRWSEVPMEGHVIHFEQLYTDRPEEINYVTANITAYLYTAYDVVYKDTSNRSLTLFFQYDHRENKAAKPRVFKNRREYMKDIQLRDSMPLSSDIDSANFISAVSYIYPSSVFQSEKKQSFPHYYEHPNIFSHYYLFCNTIRSIETDSLGSRSKPFVNNLEVYALTKGVAKTQESSFTYNHPRSDFWDKLMWLIKANDLSRTNYRFYLVTSSVDSLNLSVRFEEPSEFHGMGNDYVEQSPYYTTISRSFSEKDENSCFYFHARHLESENIQAMRMFFICSVGAVFLGFFLASLLSITGSIFTHFTTNNKNTAV